MGIVGRIRDVIELVVSCSGRNEAYSLVPTEIGEMPTSILVTRWIGSGAGVRKASQ